VPAGAWGAGTVNDFRGPGPEGCRCERASSWGSRTEEVHQLPSEFAVGEEPAVADRLFAPASSRAIDLVRRCVLWLGGRERQVRLELMVAIVGVRRIPTNACRRNMISHAKRQDEAETRENPRRSACVEVFAAVVSLCRVAPPGDQSATEPEKHGARASEQGHRPLADSRQPARVGRFDSTGHDLRVPLPRGP